MVAPIVPRKSGKINVFELARSVNMDEVVLKYTGANIERKGTRRFIVCPFHEEKTASCLVDEHRFKCFGCGEGGDRITFVKKLFGLTALEAARMICRDFGLLPVGVDASYQPELVADVAERRRQSNEQAFRRQKIDTAERILSLVLRIIGRGLRTPDDLERFGELARAQGEAETMFDELASRDAAIQDEALARFEAGWLTW